MSNYRIDFCSRNEVIPLMDFIKEHWSTTHIFTHNDKLIKWQHFNEKKGIYHFVIAKDIKNEEILAVLGFIPTNQYDPLSFCESIWLAIWKVREDIYEPGLGIELLNFLLFKEKPKLVAAIGINNKVAKLYKCLGFSLGYLNQFYMINDLKKKFQIVIVEDIKMRAFLEGTSKIERMTKNNYLSFGLSLSQTTQISIIPQKSMNYIFNRYLNHPIYTYNAYVVEKDKRYLGIIVIRIVECNNSRVLRWVDYVGDYNILPEMGAHFKRLLYEYDAEYVDVYNFGIDKAIFAKMGFRENKFEVNTVIPNYFEPFERKNIRIQYAYKNDSKSEFIIFKGDSDQDRPNFELRLQEGCVFKER